MKKPPAAHSVFVTITRTGPSTASAAEVIDYFRVTPFWRACPPTAEAVGTAASEALLIARIKRAMGDQS